MADWHALPCCCPTRQTLSCLTRCPSSSSSNKKHCLYTTVANKFGTPVFLQADYRCMQVPLCSQRCPVCAVEGNCKVCCLNVCMKLTCMAHGFPWFRCFQVHFAISYSNSPAQAFHLVQNRRCCISWHLHTCQLTAVRVQYGCQHAA